MHGETVVQNLRSPRRLVDTVGEHRQDDDYLPANNGGLEPETTLVCSNI